MFFVDKESQEFYKEKMGQVANLDSYISSLIYVLSNNKDTRNHFNEIYDINKKEINIDIFNLSWQTNESLSLCRLAFNLYGDINSDRIENGASNQYTVSSIFKNIDINIGIEAIRQRFSCKIVDKQC